MDEISISDHPTAPFLRDASGLSKREIVLAGPTVTIPFVASASTSEYGTFATVFEVANITGDTVRYTYRFRGAGGEPLAMPVQDPDCATCTEMISEGQGALGPYRGGRLVILARDPARIGWAQFTTVPHASLSVAAMLYGATEDDTVSLTGVPPTEPHRRAWLYNDNTSDLTSTLILVNLESSRAQTVQVKYHDFSDDWNTCQTSVQVRTQGQAVVNTATSLPCASRDVGLLEITGTGEFTGAGLVQHEDGSTFVRQFFDKDSGSPAYTPLPQWTVSEGRVRYGTSESAGCVSVQRKSVNGRVHTVHTSKWQKRSNESGEWADVPNTSRSAMVCAYTPPAGETGQYRGVAEITVDDGRGLYTSGNTLTVSEPPADVPRGTVSRFALDSGNSSPEGVAFGAGMVLVVDDTRNKVFAYLPSGQRVPSSDFDLAPDNRDPGGIAFGNGRVFVVDESDDKVYAYFPSGGRDTASDFELVSNSILPVRAAGIAFGDGKIFVAGFFDDNIHAYLPSGQRVPSSGFDLDSENITVSGIAFGDGRVFVVDRFDETVYAFLASGQRDRDSDLALTVNHRLIKGVAFGDGHLLVLDSSNAIYAYAYSLTGPRDPPGSQYTPLDPWSVSDGRVQFSILSAGRCITPGTINGVTYIVHTSKWQRRTGPGAAWTDVAGTSRAGQLCSYSPDQAGQYRGVAEISIDGQRGRYASRNILAGSAAVPARKPDLTVTGISASSSSVNAGERFTLSATVRNTGSGPSGSSRTLSWHRSNNATISTGDTSVGSTQVGVLQASGSSSESISLRAPSSAGTYHYGACVAPDPNESDTTNNCSVAARVTVSVASTEPPNGGSGDYQPLKGWRVSDGRVQFLFFSARQCISLSNSTINGVTYTIHSSKWQRRSGTGSAWTDISGTSRTGRICSYSPDGAGHYRAVAEITIGAARGRHASENILQVP